MNVDKALAEVWSAMLDPQNYGDDWFGIRLRELLTVASGTPLRGLFPFTSVNNLHFSRCHEYPYTMDCPSVWFGIGPHYITFAPPGRPESTVLLDTDDPVAAIEAAVRALPPEAYTTVWVGSAGSL